MIPTRHRRPRSRVRLGIALFALAVVAPSGARAVLLSSSGKARATVVLAKDATAPEELAARELADYLGKIASAEFVTAREGDPAARAGIRLFVGPTAFARQLGVRPERLDAEAWILRARGECLALVGGRPRGTLYAVYHWLEDVAGVRWWNAFEEHVPRRTELSLPFRDASGIPAFAYRDVGQIDGSANFLVRSRLNGADTLLPPEAGGMVDIGPYGFAVHNFYHYVPPDLFEKHPDYFSESEGARLPEDGQLCLSEEGVFETVLRVLRDDIRREDEAAARGRFPRTGIFDVSPNDVAAWCACPRCRVPASSPAGRSDQLIRFVNRIADSIGADRPDLFLTTLGYYMTFRGPERERARDNVIVRFSSLQWKDFSKPLSDPANREAMEALLTWRRAARHLWVWEYGVTFGDYPELPLPTIRPLARDLSLYLSLGVEGMYVQEDYPIRANLRDLKVWVLCRLLEDPDRDVTALIRDFTEGYYGPAGRYVRRYLAFLERSVREHGGRVGAAAQPADYRHLDREFFEKATRLFDLAERSVRADPVLARRVRHARLPVDRAALFLWDDLTDEQEERAQDRKRARALPFTRQQLDARCRATWAEQVSLRSYPEGPDARTFHDDVPDCGWDLAPEAGEAPR